MAATFLTSLVPLAIYFLCGRWFIRGITAGGVKVSAAMLNQAPPSTLPPQRVGDRSDGRLGAGQFTYQDDPAWAKLPDGWSFRNVAAVGVDSQDNVYVFDRGPHPLMVFDRTGAFLRSWGEGEFKRPHAVHVAPDDTVWLTD